MLAAVAALLAFTAPLASRPVATRGAAVSMGEKVLSLDNMGLYSGKAAQKAPVRVLTRIEDLRVLTSLAEAGVLSAAEEAGVFSKLESAGAISQAEKLLPLADKLQVLALAETLINVPAGLLTAAAVALLAGEVGLIAAVPDDSAPLVALQLVSGGVAGLGAVVLLASGALFSALQSTD
mmetsp:Transcript_47710/g.158108  ORF Transcript_47710/g.158108 Transcript_47710/m.158108 type:complete len:179 (-) Transcript_47710:344-880(-)